MGKSSSLMYLWMRCLIIVFCTLMAISGFVLIGVGAWVVYGATFFVDAMGSYSAQLNISFICIAIGAVVSMTSVIGCCGAWKESRSFLLAFFFIVTALFIAELVGTVVVLMYRQLADVLVYQASKKALQMMYMGPGAADPVSTAWNTVMIKFKCCGFENSTSDFKDSVFSKTTGQSYPQTCCINKTMPDCNGMNVTDSLIHPESCYKKVIAVIREHSGVLGATTGVMCIFKLAVMSLSIALFVKLGETQQEGLYE